MTLQQLHKLVLIIGANAVTNYYWANQIYIF